MKRKSLENDKKNYWDLAHGVNTVQSLRRPTHTTWLCILRYSGIISSVFHFISVCCLGGCRYICIQFRKWSQFQCCLQFLHENVPFPEQFGDSDNIGWYTRWERAHTIPSHDCHADESRSNAIEFILIFFSIHFDSGADAISDHNPRIIDEIRARKLASDLKRCAYYETCATYGLNVECVFQEACQKIVQQRLLASAQCTTPTSSRPTTPQGTRLGIASFQAAQPQQQQQLQSNGFSHNSHLSNSTSSSSNTILVNSGSMQSANNFTLPHR